MIPLGDRLRRKRFPLMTLALVVLLAGVFVWLLRLDRAALDEVFARAALVPQRLQPILSGELAQLPELCLLLSSLLLHAGWLHLLGNLLFLWVFGQAVEEVMGPLRYLAFFLLTGAVAGLVHTLVEPASAVPTVGASGAISGLLGAYLALYPRARVRTLVILVFWPLFFEIPAFVWLLLWLALQVVSGLQRMHAGAGEAAGVAWWAHVGGFAAGLAFYRWFSARRRAR